MRRFVYLVLVLVLLISAFGCSFGVGLPFVDEPDDLVVDALAPLPEPDALVDDVVAPLEDESDVQAGDDVALSDVEPEVEVPEVEELPPPVFGLIDAHADTITRALLPRHNAGLYSNHLHVDFVRLLEFGAPVQVFALWCADRYVANAFEYTNSLIDFFEIALEEHSDIIELALTLEDMERNARNGKISAVLGIEGGEALMGNLDNVDHFYNRGVRIMGITWNRENELGYGQAVDSDKGLKPFGFEVVRRMEELGMMVDVSHINEAGFWDIHRISTRPYMASHSNSYTVTPHKRNLTDDQVRAIVDSGGIIGVALYPLLLSQNGGADIEDIFAHMEHFIRLGAGHNLGLGCDFDGFATMPEGFTDVSSLHMLAEEMTNRFGEDTSMRIMSGNFYDFFVRYFGRN